MKTPAERIESCDWSRLTAQLDERGYALTQPLLTAMECAELIRLYGNRDAFRSRVIMERHNFGRGEYQYFALPLPSLVLELREHFYSQLAEIANRWTMRMNRPERFPSTLADFLESCRQKLQTLPTPLMLDRKSVV